MAQEVNEKLKGLLIEWNDKTHVYEIANDVEAEVQNFIKENTSIEVSNINAQSGQVETTYEEITKIDSDTLNKIVWKKRTNLNNKKKEIEGKRKQAVAIMINDFVDYCKALEKQLGEASDKLTALINEYKPKEDVKKTTYKLVIKTDNIGNIKKLTEIALKLGCEVSE